jgi:hypothetical protein
VVEVLHRGAAVRAGVASDDGEEEPEVGAFCRSEQVTTAPERPGRPVAFGNSPLARFAAVDPVAVVDLESGTAFTTVREGD